MTSKSKLYFRVEFHISFSRNLLWRKHPFVLWCVYTLLADRNSTQTWLQTIALYRYYKTTNNQYDDNNLLNIYMHTYVYINVADPKNNNNRNIQYKTIEEQQLQLNITKKEKKTQCLTVDCWFKKYFRQYIYEK